MKHCLIVLLCAAFITTCTPADAEPNIPTHLFAATADGPGGFRNADNTWNMVIPLDF